LRFGRAVIGLKERGMRCWIPSVAGIVLAGLSAALMAAPKDPNVTIESVTSFPDAVTLRSVRYDTRVSYRVVVKNNATNTSTCSSPQWVHHSRWLGHHQCEHRAAGVRRERGRVLVHAVRADQHQLRARQQWLVDAG
jgi:hypothetical protein